MPKLLEELLHETQESVTLDFKREINLQSFEDKREFAKDVSAFANTKGGYIVFGKEDPKEGGRIIGIDPNTFDSAKMHQIITNGCDPPVDFDVKIEEYDSKFFVILSIPESVMKPHKVTRYPKVVYKRRGDTTDIASPIEIAGMVRETQERIKGVKASTDKEIEPIVDNYEDNATVVAIFSILVMIYLPIRLLIFWGSGKGLGITNWISFELILIPISLLVCFAILIRLFGSSVTMPILNNIRKISLYYILILGIFVITVFIVNALIFLYPTSTRIFFQYTWVEYLKLSFIVFIIGGLFITVSYFPNAQFFSKLSNPQYERNIKNDTKKFLQEIKQCVNFFRKKICIVGLSLLLLFPLVIVLPDTSVGLFIPQYREGEETLSQDYYVAERIYLFIFSERLTSNTIKTTTKFYRLFQKQYTIIPAHFPLLDKIRIPNSTNITIGSTESPRLTATSSHEDTDQVGAVYVSLNETLEVNYDFIPFDYNFSSIDFDISKIDEQFNANITYWKQIDDVDVDVTTDKPSYQDMGNGTLLETYSYLIENNEDVVLEILALDFDRFMYDSVNTETTKVYSQGREWFTSFAYENRRLGLHLSIGSVVPLNVTITVQSQDIN